MASRERAFTVTNGAISYGAIVSSYGYQYDECNHLSKLTCSVLGSSWSTVYTYDSDNRPSTTTLSSGRVITNTYDAIGRLSNRAIGLNTTYNTALTYVPGNSSSKTTGLVSTYRNGSDDAYSYAYDENGNITSITQGSTSITYGYDDANRLIRENNGVLNQTITYTYDQFGNIKSKTVYAYTTVDTDQLPNLTPIEGPIIYTYNAPNGWADQLSQFGDETITYDSMGNPLTYRGYNMTWRGKQLAGITGGTKNVSFEYNEDGLRQKKTYNGVETNYYYNGSVLIGMQRGQTKYLFSYDASGNVVSVRQGNAEYYYLRNAQGDIVEIIDSTGAVKVQYTYDTWGKKVSTTGDLAGTLGLFQPFRYRGYVYDWETGLYYLQSRYYDPEVGRFISSDLLLSTGQGVMGHNAYAYCLGNPVMMVDDGGDIPHTSQMETDEGEMPIHLKHKYQFILECKEKKIRVFSSAYAAAKAWGDINRGLSKEKERMTIVYEAYGLYFYGNTYVGNSSNVIWPTLWLTALNKMKKMIGLDGMCNVVAHVHTHTDPGEKYHNDFPSCDGILNGGDKLVKTVLGYPEVYVIPYKSCEGIEVIVYSDKSTWCSRYTPPDN